MSFTHLHARTYTTHMQTKFINQGTTEDRSKHMQRLQAYTDKLMTECLATHSELHRSTIHHLQGAGRSKLVSTYIWGHADTKLTVVCGLQARDKQLLHSGAQLWLINSKMIVKLMIVLTRSREGTSTWRSSCYHTQDRLLSGQRLSLELVDTSIYQLSHISF